MGTVSARPDNLTAYRSRLEGVDDNLQSTACGLLRTLETYRTRCPEYGRDHTELAYALGEHAAAMKHLNEWVGQVGEAFRHADRAPGSAPVGAVLTTDGALKVPKLGHEDPFTAIVLLCFALFHPDPQRVHDWWFTFTQEERDAMVAKYPHLIGNLDGIPCVDRDKANRIVLSQKLEELNAQRQDLATHKESLDGTKTVEIYMLNDQLRGLNAINDRLNHAQPGQPPAFLLGLDTDGKGRAIIAINNPDTADNVITYVPGTGARLGSIGDDIPTSDVMVQSADKASRGTQTTSSITWVGYDAPQSVVFDATSDHYAKDAESSLRDFETDLRATHVGTPSRNTIIGHSYGSTTVGYTMRDGKLPVDNVIFVGSPGVGVEHASDLGIDPSHVYAGLADNDPIQFAPPESIGGAASNLANNSESLLGFNNSPDHHLTFGRDPTVVQFGANYLPADPGKSLFKGGSHSQYWDPNSSSLRAIGQIAVRPLPLCYA